MDNSVLKLILSEYEVKRNKAIQDSEERKRQLMSVNPRLSEIDNELAKISIQTSKTLLQTDNQADQKRILNELKKYF